MDNKTKLMKVVIVILTTFSNKDYLSLESIQLRLRSFSELKKYGIIYLNIIKVEIHPD